MTDISDLQMSELAKGPRIKGGQVNEQEQWWQGEAGDAYTERNRVNWLLRVPFWTNIIARTGAQHVFEAGCNFGANLVALRSVGVKAIAGCEINPVALAQARNLGFHVAYERAINVGAFQDMYDLTFTAGVLIHIPPGEIEATMDAIARASRKYILAIEYFAEDETEVEYRGARERLWKRPYGCLYQNLGLNEVASGYLKAEDGFDNCHWWLLRKPEQWV